MNKKDRIKDKTLRIQRNKEFLFFSVIFLMTVIAWIIVELNYIEKNKKFVVEYNKGMSLVIKQLPKLNIIEKLERKK